MAIGASAGPNTTMSSVAGQPPGAAPRSSPDLRRQTAARARARAKISVALRSEPETITAASRPKGGRPRAAARLGLLGVEALEIARQQRAQTGMLGLPGLEQRAPRLLAATGAPRDLVRSWNVRSAARGSPLDRPISASTTPTSVRCGKIVALGDQLRADHQIELVFGDGLQFARACARSRQACPTTAPAARLRQEFRRLFGQPLDARAAGGQRVGRAQAGQMSGRRSTWPQ